MEKQTFTFKKDQYRDVRKGYSRFLNLYCDHCGEFILLYQKDGPGPLKRMYIDRIFAPKNLVELQNVSTKDLQNLECTSCKRLIAIPSVYVEEKRIAYLLLSYSFIKKITNGEYPPNVKKVALNKKL